MGRALRHLASFNRDIELIRSHMDGAKMPRLTDVEDRISREYISDSKLNLELSSSLILIRGAMESVWAKPRLIQKYPNDGEKHTERIVYFVEKMLQANPDAKFSQQEIYLLLAGIYLHDLGMYCNIVDYTEVKKRAENLGANFDVEFASKITGNYSFNEQEEIYKNHHYLSAAWISYLYEIEDPVLSSAIKSIPSDLLEDLVNVCKFHFKLSIDDYDNTTKSDQKQRTKMIAALLRFANELDMISSPVDMESVKVPLRDPTKSVYWWLHNYTNVEFTYPDIVHLTNIVINVRLHPEDINLCRSFVREKYIPYFKKRNKPFIELLAKQNIRLAIDSSRDIEQDELAKRFPSTITEALAKNVDPIWNPPFKRNEDLFIGRQDLLDKIYEKLVINNKINPKPLLVYGDHGIGKTEIITEYAYKHRDEYTHVFWINTTSKNTLLFDFRKAFELLDLGDVFDDREAFDSVRSWLNKNEKWLLIYENVNNLSLVIDSLIYSPSGHILVVYEHKDINAVNDLEATKAERINVNVLSNFESIKVEGMTEEESKIFILRHVKNENLNDKSEIMAVLNIANRLERVPLRMKDAAEEILREKLSFKKYYYDKLSSSYVPPERPDQSEPSPPDTIERLYENSIYGARLDHFRPEKQILAGEVVKWIDDTYISKNKLKICLLIDSGTTTYQVFKEISKLLENEEKKKIWKERVCIVTNNLPGSQYLIINCKRDQKNQRSGTAIPCFLLPGKTLSSYAAIASGETIDWISEDENGKSRMRDFLEREWKCKCSDYKIISIMSTNYVAYHKGDRIYREGFWPVARGKEHFDVKKAMIRVSGEILLISPLMKFSFASVNLLNKVNQFIVSQDSPLAEDNPSKVEYEEIPIDNDKCTWFITTRNAGTAKRPRIFYNFSEELVRKLTILYHVDDVHKYVFKLEEYIDLESIDLESSREKELEAEVPHHELRENCPGQSLWDEKLVQNLEKIISPIIDPTFRRCT